MNQTEPSSTWMTDASTDRDHITQSITCLYIRIIGYGATSTLGFAINTITLSIMLVLKSRKPKAFNTQRFLVMNYYVCKLFYYGVILPLSIHTQNGDRWHGVLLTCMLYVYFYLILEGVALILLLLITFHRYFLTVHPHSKRLSFGGVRRTGIIILCGYAFILLLTLPPVLGLWGEFGYVQDIRDCGLVRGSSHSYSMFVVICAFVLPISAMLYCYMQILRVVRDQNRRVHAAAGSWAQNTATTASEARRRAQELRITKLSALVVAIFILCFLPNAVIVSCGLQDCVPQAVGAVIVTLHGVIDPLVYLYGDTQLRQVLLEIVVSKCGAERSQLAEVTHTHGQSNEVTASDGL